MQMSTLSVLCGLWTVPIPICVLVHNLELAVFILSAKPQNEFSLWWCFVGETEFVKAHPLFKYWLFSSTALSSAALIGDSFHPLSSLVWDITLLFLKSEARCTPLSLSLSVASYTQLCLCSRLLWGQILVWAAAHFKDLTWILTQQPSQRAITLLRILNKTWLSPSFEKTNNTTLAFSILLCCQFERLTNVFSLQLYKEIEICPKATKVIRFDKAESSTIGYGTYVFLTSCSFCFRHILNCLRGKLSGGIEFSLDLIIVTVCTSSNWHIILWAKLINDMICCVCRLFYGGCRWRWDPAASYYWSQRRRTGLSWRCSVVIT